MLSCGFDEFEAIVCFHGSQEWDVDKNLFGWITPFYEWKETHIIIDQGFATIVAAFVGAFVLALGWVVSARSGRTLQRSQANFEFLINQPGNEVVREFFNSYVSPKADRSDDALRQELSHATVTIPANGAAPAHDFRISTFLSHYEDLAVSVRQRLVSEKFVLLTEKTLIIRALTLSLPLIQQWRTPTRSTPNGGKTSAFCENLELLAFRFHFDQPTLEQQLIEGIFDQKMFGFTRFFKDMFLLYCKVYDPESHRNYLTGAWRDASSAYVNFNALWQIVRAAGLIAWLTWFFATP